MSDLCFLTLVDGKQIPFRPHESCFCGTASGCCSPSSPVLLSSLPPFLPSSLPLPLQLCWRVQPQQLRFIILSGVINQNFNNDQFFTRAREIHVFVAPEVAVCETAGIIQSSSLASCSGNSRLVSPFVPSLPSCFHVSDPQNSSISGCSFLCLIYQSWAAVCSSSLHFSSETNCFSAEKSWSATSAFRMMTNEVLGAEGCLACSVRNGKDSFISL